MSDYLGYKVTSGGPTPYDAQPMVQQLVEALAKVMQIVDDTLPDDEYLRLTLRVDVGPLAYQRGVAFTNAAILTDSPIRCHNMLCDLLGSFVEPLNEVTPDKLLSCGWEESP